MKSYAYSYGSVEGGQDMAQSAQHSSRLGVRGSEDLSTCAGLGGVLDSASVSVVSVRRACRDDELG